LRGDAIQFLFCTAVAAPTNKLHGFSPCDFKRDALYNGPMKKSQ
jgi:hypothetical protein